MPPAGAGGSWRVPKSRAESGTSRSPSCTPGWQQPQPCPCLLPVPAGAAQPEPESLSHARLGWTLERPSWGHGVTLGSVGPRPGRIWRWGLLGTALAGGSGHRSALGEAVQVRLLRGGSPGGLGERCFLAVSAKCFLIPGLLCSCHLPVTAPAAQGAFGDIEGVQGFLDPARNHIHMLQLHHGRCCTGVTPAAGPISPRCWQFSEVKPASSSSLQAAAGEPPLGWAREGGPEKIQGAQKDGRDVHAVGG